MNDKTPELWPKSHDADFSFYFCYSACMTYATARFYFYAIFQSRWQRKEGA